MQHEFVSVAHGDILYQLVQRTKEAVRQLDHQNYRRLKKMLMSGSAIEEGEACIVEEGEIESEPPRWVPLPGVGVGVASRLSASCSDAGNEESGVGTSPSPSPTHDDEGQAGSSLHPSMRKKRASDVSHSIHTLTPSHPHTLTPSHPHTGWDGEGGVVSSAGQPHAEL